MGALPRHLKRNSVRHVIRDCAQQNALSILTAAFTKLHIQSRTPLCNTLGWCCRVTAIRISPLLNAQAAAVGASQAAPSSLLLQGSLPGDASQLSALQVMEISGQR